MSIKCCENDERNGGDIYVIDISVYYSKTPSLQGNLGPCPSVTPTGQPARVNFSTRS